MARGEGVQNIFMTCDFLFCSPPYLMTGSLLSRFYRKLGGLGITKETITCIRAGRPLPTFFLLFPTFSYFFKIFLFIPIFAPKFLFFPIFSLIWNKK